MLRILNEHTMNKNTISLTAGFQNQCFSMNLACLWSTLENIKVGFSILDGFSIDRCLAKIEMAEGLVLFKK